MKANFRKLDKGLLFVTLLLTIFGLVMIFSSSNVAAVLRYHESSTHFFVRQVEFSAIGLVIFFLVINCLSAKWYMALSVVLLGGSILALILLRGYGAVINSAQSWFSIGGFGFQPSEFAKPAIILFLACFYGSVKRFKKWYYVFFPIIPCLMVFLLVVAQPDWGTASIIAIICMFIFFSLPVRNNYITCLKILTVMVAVVGIGGLYFLQDKLVETEAQSMQESRFTFANPCSRYQEDNGYQVCNGYIAIHNGGLWGVGLGNSTQKYLYLPESYTDFIFPIIVEELGVVGGSCVLIAYLYLLYRILVIARNSSNLRNSILAYGTFAYIFTHIVVNLAGVLALLPLTGVPLPFLSYGGSFAINLFFLLGLTERVSIENKNAKFKNDFKKVMGG